MKLLYSVLVGVCILLSTQGFAQRSCGAMDYLEQQHELNPELIRIRNAIERHTQRYIVEGGGQQRALLLTIPVVVHVVYKTNAQNVSDAQIQSQIDVLNEDFRMLNADSENIWGQKADVEIEFCLATVAPDGSPTDGIQRRKTNKPSFGVNDQMKFNNQGGINAWPAGDYLNMWVCNLNGYLGYAQFPGGPDATDGVVIDYQAFGRIGTASPPFHLGRTATHEVGHWLNLRHIWGDGPCSVDDFVGDTPVSDAPNFGCAIGHVSCGTTDMVQNYMDYSDDDCMNLFTGGQKTRMHALFSAGGARVSLLDSDGCGGSPPADPTCDDGIQNQGEEGIDCGGPCPTPCPPATCGTPGGLFADGMKKKTAKLNWDAVPGALSYDARYRESGSQGSWSVKSSTTTSTNATGLNEGTTYEWQVQAHCDGASGDWSELCYFVGGDSGSSTCGAGSRLSAGASFSVYPNPASSEINIGFPNGAEGGYSLVVFSPIGQVVHLASGDQQEGKVFINASSWPRGLYLVEMRTSKGSATRTLVLR